MQPNLWLTPWGAIRSGHDDDTVLEQILKKLLENHGIGNISDLKYVKHTNDIWEAHHDDTCRVKRERSHHSFCG